MYEDNGQLGNMAYQARKAKGMHTYINISSHWSESTPKQTHIITYLVLVLQAVLMTTMK